MSEAVWTNEMVAAVTARLLGVDYWERTPRDSVIMCKRYRFDWPLPFLIELALDSLKHDGTVAVHAVHYDRTPTPPHILAAGNGYDVGEAINAAAREALAAMGATPSARDTRALEACARRARYAFFLAQGAGQPLQKHAPAVRASAAPQNNDNRTDCYACGGALEEREMLGPGSTYRVCTMCGR